MHYDVGLQHVQHENKLKFMSVCHKKKLLKPFCFQNSKVKLS